MPEVLGEAGRYFDPLDVKDMAENIIALLEDDEARQDLGERAYQRAHLFSRKATSDKTAEVIKSVVPERYTQVSSNQSQTSP
jgi:glycosyltransferase involved in cell wall biosynthesis